jgi:hypothetical protein
MASANLMTLKALIAKSNASTKLEPGQYTVEEPAIDSTNQIKNEYDTKPDKRGNRRSGARNPTAEKAAREAHPTRSKPRTIKRPHSR